MSKTNDYVKWFKEHGFSTDDDCTLEEGQVWEKELGDYWYVMVSFESDWVFGLWKQITYDDDVFTVHADTLDAALVLFKQKFSEFISEQIVALAKL